MVRGSLAERGSASESVGPGLAVAAAEPERGRTGAATGVADECGRGDDGGKRHVEEEDRDEGGSGNRHHGPVLQRARADPPDGMQHDGQHRGLEAEEQPCDETDIAEGGIDPAQAQDRQETRQDEQRAGNEAALGAVQQPADIDRQLLRLRPRQQHAVVERVQEAVLADPALFLDQNSVHHGDLAGRPAEAQRGDAKPDPHGVGEHDAMWFGGAGRRSRRVERDSHCLTLAFGQLCVSPVASRHQR